MAGRSKDNMLITRGRRVGDGGGEGEIAVDVYAAGGQGVIGVSIQLEVLGGYVPRARETLHAILT